MLDHDRQRRAEAVFLGALAQPETAREAYVREACGSDASLADEVEALIRAYDDSADLLGQFHSAASVVPLDDDTRIAPDALVDSDPPAHLGGYALLEQIGRGGMGVVYRARQQRPERLVALKVMRHGLATPKLLRRFEHEAEILGRLEHPNIARIYEAHSGADNPNAQPFFAMELIDGVPLTQYAVRQKLSIRARLELMARVADGVQHAHQRGVVHRDLKPDNILIDAAGQPKVLDFGVARLMDVDVRAATLATDAGQIVGTLHYMSPEQLAGDSTQIDTRTDVYALGVILFELLTGALPFDIAGKSIAEAIRIKSEQEPMPLRRLTPRYDADLATLVESSMEQDRERRYATAGEFAADIRRYLNNQPLAARPQTTWYQLRKFARRNRTLVIGMGATAAALVGGLIATSLALVWALDAEQRAHDRAADAEAQKQAAQVAQADAEAHEKRSTAVMQFLVDTFAAPDPTKAGREVRIVDRLADAYEALPDAFPDDRHLQGSVATAIGQTYYGLGQYEEAVRVLGRAAEDYRVALGPDDSETLGGMNDYALALQNGGALDEAIAIYEDTLERKRRVEGPHAETTLTTLMNYLGALRQQGRLAECLPLAREALAAYEEELGADHPRVLAAYNNVAALLNQLGKTAEAVVYYERTLEGCERFFGPDDPRTLITITNLATAYETLGDLDRAIELFEQAIAIGTQIMPPEHPSLRNWRNGYAMTLMQAGRIEDADAVMTEIIAALPPIAESRVREELVAHRNHALLLLAREAPVEAERVMRAVRAQGAEILGEDDYLHALSSRTLARTLMAQGRLAEAEPLAEAALAETRAQFDEGHREIRNSIKTMAELRSLQGRDDEAAELTASMAP